ncbi:hypothetical protein GCM10027200_64790 [Lentzea nigeriaca]
MVIGALVGAVFGWGYYLLARPSTAKVLCPSGGMECFGVGMLTAGGGLVLVLVLAGLTLRLLGLRPAWPTGCLSGVIIIAGLVVSANAGVGTRFDFAAIGVFAFAYAFAAVLTTGWGADGL